MKAAALEEVSLRLGAFSLRDVSLTLAPGEILAILGPNGAGKSVTLETIAGFHHPEKGRIVIAGRDVTGLPPERRGVGLVFQNYGLFPHLTVGQNVGFSHSRQRNPGARPRDYEVGALLTRFGIRHLAERLPANLSPGEKQRTALARALAGEPRLFLFDEPFSALDQRTRETLREELGQFLRESGIPAIFVTHDHVDAAVLADRLAIMRDGRIVQSGTVADVFEAPADGFVADFTGIENRLPGRLLGPAEGLFQVAIGARLLQVQGAGSAVGPGNVLICIRAEDIALVRPDSRPGLPAPGHATINRLPMRVVRVSGLGALTKVMLEGGFPLTAALTRRGARELGLVPGRGSVGRDAVAEIAPDAIHVLAAP